MFRPREIRFFPNGTPQKVRGFCDALPVGGINRQLRRSDSINCSFPQMDMQRVRQLPYPGPAQTVKASHDGSHVIGRGQQILT